MSCNGIGGLLANNIPECPFARIINENTDFIVPREASHLSNWFIGNKTYKHGRFLPSTGDDISSSDAFKNMINIIFLCLNVFLCLIF